MSDVLGNRAKLAVLIPSTNTVVEPEYHAMAPPGVTVHAGRLMIRDPDTGSDAAFVRLMDQVQDAMPDTVQRVMTCHPTRLVLGMTAVAFLGGPDGEARTTSTLEAMAGVPVTSGPASVAAALAAFGARRVAVLSPYQPVAEDHVANYFASIGRPIVRAASVRSVNATSIAQVPLDETRRLVRELDGPDVDAIVQVGTNLPMMGLVAELEAEIGKPVIPINGSTLWAALRASGIDDRIAGFGRMLAEH